MLQLPNGCRCSKPTIIPENWDQPDASIDEPWYIRYRFYDPGVTKPKQVVIKGGVNKLHTLAARRGAIKFLLEEELRMLKNDGANPATRQSKSIDADYDIHPNTGMIAALQMAFERVDCVAGTKNDIKSVLKHFSLAARQIRTDTMAISKVTRKEILFTLERCGRNKGNKWTANNFNHYRGNLMILFSELVEIMAIDVNPLQHIKKRRHSARLRETMAKSDRTLVDQHLRKKGLTSFRLFIRIFFQSGSRITEMLNLKGSQVNLQEQYFIVTIKKGRQYHQVRKTIRNSALPYWKMIMKHCKKSDFVFGRDLVPGKINTTAPQITRRWHVHVKWPLEKGGLGLSADFYSLKHSNSTETSGIYGVEAAADQNSHRSNAMVVKIYDTRNKDRKHEELKKVNVSFL